VGSLNTNATPLLTFSVKENGNVEDLMKKIQEKEPFKGKKLKLECGGKALKLTDSISTIKENVIIKADRS